MALGVQRYITKSPTNVVKTSDGTSAPWGAIRDSITQSGFGSSLAGTRTAGEADIADFEIPAIDWGKLGGNDGSGSSGPPASYYRDIGEAALRGAGTAEDAFNLNKAKFGFDQAKTATANDLAQFNIDRQITGARTAQQYYLDQLKLGGAPGTINPELAATLEAQRTGREGALKSQYDQILGQIGTASTAAGTLQTAGSDALKRYLEENAQNPYADAALAAAPAPTITNPLEQYMGAQGVDTTRVDPTIAALNTASQGGAANYNNLLTTLAAASTSSQQSRLREQEMSRTYNAAQLAATRAQQEGNLSQAQLSALQNIQEQYSAAKFKLQQDSIARNQALQDALASLESGGFTGLQTSDEAVAAKVKEEEAKGGTTAATGTTTALKTALQKLQAVPVTKNKVLAKKIAAFAAAKPNANQAMITKAFPSLGKKIFK